jgi:hypothetical protein
VIESELGQPPFPPVIVQPFATEEITPRVALPNLLPYGQNGGQIAEEYRQFPAGLADLNQTADGNLVLARHRAGAILQLKPRLGCWLIRRDDVISPTFNCFRSSASTLK